jgi:lysophospholipase L1-like esterase
MKKRIFITVLSISLTANVLLSASLVLGVTSRTAISGRLQSINPSIYTETADRGHSERALVTCWGDSLTAGAGAPIAEGYPSQLSLLLRRPTRNEGIAGETSTQIRARMVHRQPGLDQGITIIWAGRNNFTEPQVVLDDIHTMVQSLPAGSYYLVLSIINGDYPGEEKGGEKYQIITALNAELQRIYGDRFVQIRDILVAKGPRNDRDIISADLRADQIHLRAAGYQLTAQVLQDKISSLGW